MVQTSYNGKCNSTEPLELLVTTLILPDYDAYRISLVGKLPFVNSKADDYYFWPTNVSLLFRYIETVQ